MLFIGTWFKKVGSSLSKAREPESFYQFHTRLFKKNRFRKFVSETTDLWIQGSWVTEWPCPDPSPQVPPSLPDPPVPLPGSRMCRTAPPWPAFRSDWNGRGVPYVPSFYGKPLWRFGHEYPNLIIYFCSNVFLITSGSFYIMAVGLIYNSFGRRASWN